jgi:hypothetical protein
LKVHENGVESSVPVTLSKMSRVLKLSQPIVVGSDRKIALGIELDFSKSFRRDKKGQWKGEPILRSKRRMYSAHGS